MTLSLGLGLSLHGQGGNGGVASPAALWYDAAAAIHVDVTNDRYWINGVEYLNRAAAVAAGAVTINGTGQPTIALPASVTTNMAANGLGYAVAATTAGSVPVGQPQYLFTVDDGTGANRSRVEWQTSGILRSASFTASATQATPTNGGATAINTRCRVSGRVRPNDFATSFDAGTPVTDVVGTIPVFTTLMLCNEGTLAQKWLGTLEEVIIYPGVWTNALMEYSSHVLNFADDYILDGSWVGPTVSVAIERGNYTYVGVQLGTPKYPAVFRFHKSNGKIAGWHIFEQSTSGQDDHCSAALAFLSNGTLLAENIDHGLDGVVRVHRSTTGNPADFGALVTAYTGTSSEYGQFLIQTDDTAWLVWQESDVSWELLKSTDAGLNWTRKKRLYTGSGFSSPAQYYCFCWHVADDNVILLCLPHSGNAVNVLRIGKLDLTTGNVTSGGGTLGNIEDATPDTAIGNHANLSALYTPAAGHSVSMGRLHKSGTAFTISDFVTADGTGLKYYLVKYNGSGSIFTAANWTFTEITSLLGGFIAHVFAEETHSNIRMYAAKDNGDSTYSIYRCETADGGANWTTTLVTTPAGSGATAYIRTLISPKGSTGGLVYKRGTFTDLNTWEQNVYLLPNAAA